MAFCIKEKQLIDGGITCIDNKFILNYVPDAPDKCLAVYLLGLALAESDGADNACDTIAKKLDISAEEVFAAYLYWEELGLVCVTNETPRQVIYLNVRDNANALKKVKPSKYAKFTREIQNVIEGRMITPNEFDAYYTFLENTTFEQEALVAVAKYCAELKGADINYRYILTVARNQLHKGATTLAVVQDNLNSQQKYDEDLKLVFKALGITKKFEHTDREMYEKWTKEFGFTQDVIVTVAKTMKGKGMNKLDADISEYYKKGALSLTEIQYYKQQKQRLTELAKQLNRTIGVYYQSVDTIIDEYLLGWISRGYDDETLLAVAKFCFRSGIRTLQGVASIIDKLYKNGITTVSALDNYLADLTRKDARIKRVLELAGLERNVTNSDRALFKTWTKWEISDEVIDFAAEKSAGTVAPMAYVNRILSDCKQKGLTTLEQVKANEKTTATSAKKVIIGNDIQRAEYTDEQINALFTALDETEE